MGGIQARGSKSSTWAATWLRNGDGSKRSIRLTGDTPARRPARNASLPVIVYTTLAPASMRHVMRLARLGVQHVVLNRFDDEPRRFLELIERVPAHPVAELTGVAPMLGGLIVALFEE